MKKISLYIVLGTVALVGSALGSMGNRLFQNWAAPQVATQLARTKFNSYLQNYLKQQCEPVTFGTKKYWSGEASQHSKRLDREARESEERKITVEPSLPEKAIQKVPYYWTAYRTYNLLNSPFSNPLCPTTPSAPSAWWRFGF